MKTSLAREEKNKIIDKLSIQLLNEPIDALNKKIERLNSLISISLFNFDFMKKRRQAYLDYMEVKNKYKEWFNKSDVTDYIKVAPISKWVSYKGEKGSYKVKIENTLDEADYSIKEKVRQMASDLVKIPSIINTNLYSDYSITINEKIDTEEGGEYKEITSIITKSVENQENRDLVCFLINNKNKVLVEGFALIYNKWVSVVNEIIGYNSVNTLYQALPSLKSIIEEVTGVKLNSNILKKEKYNENINNIIKYGINTN